MGYKPETVDSMWSQYSSVELAHMLVLCKARLERSMREKDDLWEEVRQARRAWLGDDYGHLPLAEAIGKRISDTDTELDAAQEELAALRDKHHQSPEYLAMLRSMLSVKAERDALREELRYKITDYRNRADVESHQ